MFAHAFSREIALPRTDAARYQKQARVAVGLTSADLRRFATESAWLRANDGTSPLQHAEDVIDLDERTALMAKSATAYAALHARAPELMLWAGFAAIAVNDGVRPAADLAIASARLARNLELGDAIARLAEDGIKCAFETNLRIYCDLAWVHHAFLEGGIEVIRWLREDRAIAPAIADGFEDIARGQLLGGERGWHLIAHGNLALFEHEQRVIVTPVFAKYAAALQAASDLGLVAIPNQDLATASGTPAWQTTHPRESYGPLQPRWDWLVIRGWWPFCGLHRRRELGPSLARAASGRSEHRVPTAHGFVRLAQSLLDRLAE